MISRKRLRKLIKKLKNIKGRHTELISVYVPSGYSLNQMVRQLEEEKSEAKNIKSKRVRKNVISALDKISRHLQAYKKAPKNGVAVFCGNVSEKEGRSDIEIWALEPPEKLNTKLYWCDQRFDLSPLEDMAEEKEVYGILVMDKSEADLGILSGKKIIPKHHFESIVPGKTRAGGQSAQRFSRVREGMLQDWYKKIGEIANRTFEKQKNLLGILVAGPGPIKENFLKEDHMHQKLKDKVLGPISIGTTGEPGLKEAVRRAEKLLKDASVTKEKNLLDKFFSELRKDSGLVVYGMKQVLKAMEMGAIDTLIVSEDLELEEKEYECDCNTDFKKKIMKPDETTCPDCKKEIEILGRRDISDALEDIADNYGSSVEVVSTDTEEGQRFLELGGVGGLLRYQIE